jgi:general secretion pathway protein L
VVLADDITRSPTPIDLLPETHRGEREGGAMRRVQLGLAAAVLVLLGIALAFPLWQKREAAITLMPVLAKAQSEAAATQALKDELERHVADYNFLLSKKHTAQPVLAFVEELSRLLPDSTWVQQMDIRPQGKVREIQIQGETPSSSKLIEIFETATTMRNATPRGSVTRGSVPGTERFLIAAEAKPRALPEPMPAAAPIASTVPAPASPAAPATAPATAPAPSTAPAPAASAPPQPETMGGSRPPPPTPAKVAPVPAK